MEELTPETVDTLFDVESPVDEPNLPEDIIEDEPVPTSNGETVIKPIFEPGVFRFLSIRVTVSGVRQIDFIYVQRGVTVTIPVCNLKNMYLKNMYL